MADQKRNIVPAPFPALTSHDDDAKNKFVAAIHQYAVQRAEEAINWYWVRKRPKQLWAQGLRVISIVLATVGGVVPFVVASKVWPDEYSQFGYVALALAGASVALDRFFGYSSAWMRYVMTATTLQRVLNEFHIDWSMAQLRTAQAAPTATDHGEMLKRVQTLLQRVLAEIEKETGEWAAEYRRNLSELEKSARQELESSKPGVINLTVTNAGQFQNGVTVLLDETPRQTMLGTDCQITPVFPGDHIVRVNATLSGRTLTAAQAVTVAPGSQTSVVLALPLGGPVPPPVNPPRL